MAPQTPDQQPDLGPAQRWQHAGRMYEHTGDAVAARVIEENVIDILHLRHFISPRQNDAALRLMYDFQRAGLEPSVTSRYSPASRNADFFAAERDHTEREEAAYQRWRKAVHALGIRYSEIVIATVCMGTPPLLSALPHLRKGLERLADWYGLSVGGS